MIKRLARDAVFNAWTRLLGDNGGFVNARVVRGPGAGLRVKLNLLSGLETGYLYGSYEYPIVSRLPELIGPGATVWDCGCHIGYYTCIFARLVGPHGNIVAVEPDPANMKRIRHHVDLNGFKNVQYVDTALGTGEVVDFIISGNTNSHIAGAWIGDRVENYRSKEVIKDNIRLQSESLDSLLRRPGIPRPDWIKIDIEGFELTALQYAQTLMQEVRPRIILELHNPDCDAFAWDFAQRWGYELSSMTTGQRLMRKSAVGGTVLLSPQ